MTSTRLKLVSRWQNSAGERVRIAMNLKQVDYDYVARGDLSKEEFEAINPQGLLPALVVDGRSISQSAAILAYIEETWPSPSLLPSDPVTRAQARSFAAFIAGEMHALTVNRVRNFLADQLGVDEQGVGRWVGHWMQLGLTSLEAMLGAREKAHPFCYGDRPGLADLHLVPQMAAARRLGTDVDAFPLLCGVERRCVDLDAFRRARPENQPDFPPRPG